MPERWRDRPSTWWGVLAGAVIVAGVFYAVRLKLI